MRRRAKKKLQKALCLLMFLILFIPIGNVNNVYGFNWEEILDDVDEHYQDNLKKISIYLQNFNMKSPTEYQKLLSSNRKLIEENFIQIMEDCKSKKEKVVDAFYNAEEFDWLNWGLNIVKVQKAAMEVAPEKRVKVAIIDSGVNYSSDIDVVERKNFIPDHEGISILYEDISGHGTNIAGIIAAKDNGEGITGVNPNVELYSAKVLDAANNAPISRVVEGIEWAIEKNVNIINISFTTETNSKELYDVIKKAYAKGILIVAAAGNKGFVEYPAAYPEVIAVGSVGSTGKISVFSPSGATVELVAPGELITATDVFNSLSTSSGTSYAAPYVTAIASLLWEKDLSCTNNFIRCVLNCSANLYGNDDRYGYGLVDYKFAEVVYSLLKPLAQKSMAFEALMKYAVDICGIYNPTSIPCVSAPEDLVEGAWAADGDGEYAHRMPFLGDDYNLVDRLGKSLILAGCVIADVPGYELNGMYLNPYLHGFYYYSETGRASNTHTDANYLAGGLYLTYVAKAMLSGTTYTTSSIYVTSGNHSLVGLIDNTYINSRAGITWEDVKEKIESYGKRPNSIDKYVATFDPNSSKHRALVIYGLAIHSLTDIFAHSAMVPETGSDGKITYKRVMHDSVYVDGKEYKLADWVDYVPERYDAATKVAQNTLRLISRMGTSNTSTTSYSNYLRANMSVFDLSEYDYDQHFKLAHFKRYANEVCNLSGLFKNSNEWNNFFNAISYDEVE